MINMPTTYVRFIHVNPNIPDDMVAIKRTGVDKYQLTYSTTHTDTNDEQSHSAILDDRTVFRWFRSVIRMLELDEEPFHRLQLDLPNMPSFLFNTRNIGAYYHRILDAVELWLDEATEPSAPLVADSDAESEIEMEIIRTPQQPVRASSSSPPPAPVRRSHHMFFDLGDD